MIRRVNVPSLSLSTTLCNGIAPRRCKLPKLTRTYCGRASPRVECGDATLKEAKIHIGYS